MPNHTGQSTSRYCQGMRSPSAKIVRSSPRESSAGCRSLKNCRQRSDSSPSAESASAPTPPGTWGCGTSQPQARLGSALVPGRQGCPAGEEKTSQRPCEASRSTEASEAWPALEADGSTLCAGRRAMAPRLVLQADPARQRRTASSMSGEARAANAARACAAALLGRPGTCGGAMPKRWRCRRLRQRRAASTSLVSTTHSARGATSASRSSKNSRKTANSAQAWPTPWGNGGESASVATSAARK
mmetsp:Transcript_140116/g.390616  ORF Transcript_140116/g.390616 Transcript_140116/m.390616 type:complete len:244 (+) Transcript_140116:864-1595(+)